MEARLKARQVKERFNRDIITFCNTHHNGVIIGVLTYACKGDDNRRMVQKYLTGHVSSKDLIPAEWWAMWNFVQPEKPAGGRWQSARGEELEQDCVAILLDIVDQEGQLKMEFTHAAQ